MTQEEAVRMVAGECCCSLEAAEDALGRFAYVHEAIGYLVRERSAR